MRRFATEQGFPGQTILSPFPTTHAHVTRQNALQSHVRISLSPIVSRFLFSPSLDGFVSCPSNRSCLRWWHQVLLRWSDGLEFYGRPGSSTW